MTEKEVTAQSIEESARLYHETFGANVLAIGKDGKKPSHKYTKAPHDFKARKQTTEEVSSLPWGKAGGVALVCGVGGWVCLDFDEDKDSERVVSFDTVSTLCEALGVDPNEYEWLVRSGSGTGYHLWLSCSEDCSTEYDGAGVVHWLPKEGGFHHLEHRWRDCYTIAPPSLHPSGGHYEFVNCTFPSTPPVRVTKAQLLEALGSIATREGEDTTTQEAEKPEPGTVFLDQETGEVVSSDNLEQRQQETKAEARARFDVIGYIQRHLGTNDVHRVGGEYRIGKEGTGLGGWFVKADKQTWNTFREGGGEIGGDCFELVGYVLFGTSYDKRRKEHWRAVLEEVSRETGVRFPEYRPQRTGTQGSTKTETRFRNQSGSGETRAHQVQDFISARFELRWNIIRLRLEYRTREGEGWSDVTDGVETSWRVTFEKIHGKRVGREAFSDYVRDLAENYDPFRTYFDGLPKHDGHDHIGELVALVQTTNPELFREHTTRWLVGAYACSYFDAQHERGGNKNELFLVLTGGQGVGKTTFLRALVPPPLTRYRLEGSLSDNKEASQLLAGSFVSLNDELTTLDKVSQEHLKALLSSEFFSFRPPYGRHPEHFPRRVSFCGSTNQAEFLRDPTGNRRYLVHRVDRVNLQALASFDIGKVWAQVRALYEGGFRHYLVGEEQARLEDHNSQFTEISTEEALLIRYFEPAHPDSEPHEARFLSTSEVALRIAELYDEEHTSTENRGLSGDVSVRDGVPRFRGDNVATVRRVGQALQKNHFPRKSIRVKGSPKWVYVLREIPKASWQGTDPGTDETEAEGDFPTF